MVEISSNFPSCIIHLRTGSPEGDLMFVVKNTVNNQLFNIKITDYLFDSLRVIFDFPFDDYPEFVEGEYQYSLYNTNYSEDTEEWELLSTGILKYYNCLRAHYREKYNYVEYEG